MSPGDHHPYYGTEQVNKNFFGFIALTGIDSDIANLKPTQKLSKNHQFSSINIRFILKFYYYFYSSKNALIISVYVLEIQFLFSIPLQRFSSLKLSAWNYEKSKVLNLYFKKTFQCEIIMENMRDFSQFQASIKIIKGMENNVKFEKLN